MTNDIFFMGLEAQLDRIQALLEREDYKRAQMYTRRLLGLTRSEMNYNKRREQQTLIAFGFGRFGSHRKRLEKWLDGSKSAMFAILEA